MLKIKIENLTYEDFNSSLKKNNILNNHYKTRLSNPGKCLILFKKECKQNKITTLLDQLEYYNKIDVKPFLEALLIQRETFYEYNIDIFKDFFTVSSIAKHILARFSEIYYQRDEFKPDTKSIEIDREYIETKIRNYSDSDRKEKRCIPLTVNNIIDIINREHQQCYYCKITLYEWILDRLNNNIDHQASNCVLCCILCNKA